MKKYIKSLKKTPSPILPSQITEKINIRELMEYARKKGVKVADLSEEEKKSFLK